MRFSIIIPVYNAAEFLQQCLDSISVQICTDFEVLLVDDGSNDNSVEICNKYLSDNRFRLIKKVNGGVSSARNVGLCMAKGEYMLFIDSDDVLPDDALLNFQNSILRNNNDVDFIFGRTATFNKDINCFAYNCSEYGCSVQSKPNLMFLWVENHITNAVWGAIYKTSIVKENKIKFDENLCMGEDGDWLYKFLLNAKKYNYVNTCVYLYRQDETASNYKKTGFKYAFSSWNYQSRWYDYFIENYNEVDKKQILSKFANGYLSTTLRISSLEKSDKKKMKDLFMKKDYILKSCSKKVKILALCYNFFGFNFLMLSTNLLFKIKGIKKCTRRYS